MNGTNFVQIYKEAFMKKSTKILMWHIKLFIKITKQEGCQNFWKTRNFD